MKCPRCEKDGKRSTIGGIRFLPVTDMSTHVHYDEDGRRHWHDPNRHGFLAVCSRGHRLHVIKGNKCQIEGCAFGDEGSIRVIAVQERQP
jgi:hypothetical protein